MPFISFPFFFRKKKEASKKFMYLHTRNFPPVSLRLRVKKKKKKKKKNSDERLHRDRSYIGVIGDPAFSSHDRAILAAPIRRSVVTSVRHCVRVSAHVRTQVASGRARVRPSDRWSGERSSK